MKITLTCLPLAFALACTGGGGGPEQGMNTLSIVGDRNVTLDSGQQTTLTVRYLDDSGSPLAGKVSFSLHGEAAGASLGAQSVQTGENGTAEVQLTAGDEVDFPVVAEAPGADPAEWRVQVGGDSLPPLNASGDYAISSNLGLVGALPEDADQAVSVFIEMTDGENDPAKYIVDKMIEEAELGWVESALATVRWLVDPALNTLILEESPELVAELNFIGEQLGLFTETFALDSDLEVTESSATHVAAGFSFMLEGAEHSFEAAQYDVSPAASESFSFNFSESDMQVTIDQHALPLPLGGFMVVALNEAIVPAVDPQSEDLGDLLLFLIDCQAVGEKISSYIPGSSPEAFAGGCELALEATATQVEARALALDENGLELVLQGSASARDSDDDRETEELVDGMWTGSVSYQGGEIADLPDGENGFSGVKVRTED